jgi:hypothetical protein
MKWELKRSLPAMQTGRPVTVDSFSANWLMPKALAVHKTPAEIISGLIQKEITAAL